MYLLTSTDDTSLTLNVYSQHEIARTFTQELRFNGSLWDRGDWLFGLYALNETMPVNTTVRYEGSLPAFGATPGVKQGTISIGEKPTYAYAAFGQIRYRVLDQLTLSLGARYSWERKADKEGDESDFADAFPPALPFKPTRFFYGHQSWGSFTPQGGARIPSRRWLAGLC